MRCTRTFDGHSSDIRELKLNIATLERRITEQENTVERLNRKLIDARLITPDYFGMSSYAINVDKLRKIIIALLDHLDLEFTHINEDRIVQK